MEKERIGNGYSRESSNEVPLSGVATQNGGTTCATERIPPGFCDHQVKTLVHNPRVFYDVRGQMVRRVMKLQCAGCKTVFTEEWDRDE